jgi:hypothetical protein
MLKSELSAEIKFLLSLVIFSLLGAASVSAANVEITKGRLFDHSSFTTQVISATNNTGSTIDTLWIECGFFRGGVLLAAEKQYGDNVQPGQTVYMEITSEHAQGADQTDCRVSKIY